VSNTIDYGIDLGTTNSCVARWESGAVKVFQNNDQMNVTPSAVHILRTGRVIVGRRGHSAILTDPDNVAVEFKRWMGQKDRTRFPAAQRDLSAEELSAEILKSLREDVRRQTGADMHTAVVTVPAAFGALQCEATARAAALAGLTEAPLLQEPIAAAIGYGVHPDSANQRWLVFDLGGGTLDIAVVSTRDGRLNVLEHRGNNLLGGKDFDRLIVEQLLMPALDSAYNLRDTKPNSARAKLLSRLRFKAEEAKIDLSRDSNVLVSLFDIGADDDDQPIDLEVPVQRGQLDTLMEPILNKCFDLAREALNGARLAASDLDRVLLVGGPTQSPYLRNRLREELGIQVDHSADPMTVVGQGAAVYAATLERTHKAVAVISTQQVSVKLAYDAVSAESQCSVAGLIASGDSDIEIKIDSEGGLWTSGWIKPDNGFFEVVVSLKHGDITTLWVYARDGQGRLIETDTPEFKIRHGLVPSAPPLPHTLSFEVLNAEGSPVLDPVFLKGTPLPAEKTVKYRAAHALRPDNAGSDLAIKLWEGEFLSDPDTNEWVGNLILSHEQVRRSVPEGSEIEVTVSVSASRLINVSAFVKHLNQHFTEHVYLPQREEQDFSDLSQTAVADAEVYEERLDQLEMSSDEQPHIQDEISELRRELKELAARTPASNGQGKGAADPDEARRVVEHSKTIRGRIGRLERKVVAKTESFASVQFLDVVEKAEDTIAEYGDTLDKQQFAVLRRELERVAIKEDDKAVKRVTSEIDALRWRVIYKQDWFWREILESLSKPDAVFVNGDEAQRLLSEGRAAIAKGDGDSLRETVRALWRLQPKEKAVVIRERVSESGLRKF
jgi:molecular chaperone DnaK